MISYNTTPEHGGPLTEYVYQPNDSIYPTLIPRYSGDEWQLVAEAIYDKGYCWSICPKFDPGPRHQQGISVSMWDDNNEWNTEADTIGLAVAQAAYLALGKQGKWRPIVR